MEGILPKGWIFIKLDFVTEILDNKRKPINSEERAERIGTVPYYGATGQVGWIDDFIFDEELVLLGEDGAPFFDNTKNVAYLIQGKSWVNNHAHVLKAKSGLLENKFLLHYLNKFDYTGYVGGTTRLKLNQNNMKNIPVPLPPLPEQTRIVAKLDALFAHIDTLKTKLDRIPELLKNFRQQVLTQAVTGKFYRINTYKLTTLGKLGIHIQTGPFGSALHKEDYIENGIPIINPSHIFDGLIIPNYTVTVSQEKFEELKVWELSDGDIILGRRGEMGRAAKYSEKSGIMLCGTGSLILRKSNEIDPDFLSYYLRSPFAKSFLESNSVGSTMINLNQNIVKELPIPNVPREEQQEIVRRVEELFRVADTIEACYKSLKEKIDTLPQAILTKAFKGELVPQDPKDEPASLLLERIKKEKISKI